MNQSITLSVSNGSEDKIRVLIVDDSPLICGALKQILSSAPEIEVIGCAPNGQEALSFLSSIPCDVCMLDVNMPGINGLTVLKQIMIKSPKPILMASFFTDDGFRKIFDAFRYGAVDFFQKPVQKEGEDLLSQTIILQDRVKRAAMVQIKAARYLRLNPVSQSGHPKSDREVSAVEFLKGIVIVSTSTGGYSALLSLLPNMSSRPEVPIIVSLGTPARYLNAFIEYLKTYVSFEVLRGCDREILERGKIYLISNEEFASLEQTGDSLRLIVSPGVDLSDRHETLDLLLFSASKYFGPGTMAVFLSGDKMVGLGGAQVVSRNGGRLLVQRPETCLAPALPDRIVRQLKGESRSPGELSLLMSKWKGI
jgi:two-component system chemotaxis response regulator CheB